MVISYKRIAKPAMAGSGVQSYVSPQLNIWYCMKHEIKNKWDRYSYSDCKWLVCIKRIGITCNLCRPARIGEKSLHYCIQ
jgi:hypothetical protein